MKGEGRRVRVKVRVRATCPLGEQWADKYVDETDLAVDDGRRERHLRAVHERRDL